MVNICFSTIKQNLRDRRSLTLMLLLPIVLTLILGTALSKVGTNTTTTSLNIRGGIVNQDQGPLAASMIDFFQEKQIRAIMQTRIYKTVADANKDLKKQNLDAIIVITKGFSAAAESGQSHHLDFITSGDMESSAVRSITDSFLKRVNAVQALAAIGVSPQKSVQTHLDPLLSDHALSVKGKVPEASGYYAVTMLIMIILFAYNYGLNVVRESLHSPIGYRIQSLPVHPMSYFTGKALGHIATVFLQIILLISFFKFIYKADFGDHLWLVLGLCFLLAFIVILAGTALALLFTEKTADALMMFLVPIATFLSGGYVKLSFLETNPVTSAIRGFMPNSLVQTLIFQDIYGGSGLSPASAVLKLLIILAAVLLLVAAELRRRNYGSLSK
ncbi:ABC transporter permease [Sporolactobacillus putidus]|nr:ABC transporter permease [Sporolactobacillus putidus]